MLSKEHIDNKVLNITSEPPYAEDHFRTIFQANLSPSDQIFERQEEELIDFKEKKHME